MLRASTRDGKCCIQITPDSADAVHVEIEVVIDDGPLPTHLQRITQYVSTRYRFIELAEAKLQKMVWDVTEDGRQRDELLEKGKELLREAFEIAEERKGG